MSGVIIREWHYNMTGATKYKMGRAYKMALALLNDWGYKKGSGLLS